LRVFADSNITAPAVKAMREAGLDVVYSGERAVYPGDEALLAEAAAAGAGTKSLLSKRTTCGPFWPSP
jgi:hypothetical protein